MHPEGLPGGGSRLRKGRSLARSTGSGRRLLKASAPAQPPQAGAPLCAPCLGKKGFALFWPLWLWAGRNEERSQERSQGDRHYAADRSQPVAPRPLPPERGQAGPAETSQWMWVCSADSASPGRSGPQCLSIWSPRILLTLLGDKSRPCWPLPLHPHPAAAHLPSLSAPGAEPPLEDRSWNAGRGRPFPPLPLSLGRAPGGAKERGSGGPVPSSGGPGGAVFPPSTAPQAAARPSSA